MCGALLLLLLDEAGPYQARAQELYTSLRDNVLSTILSQYKVRRDTTIDRICVCVYAYKNATNIHVSAMKTKLYIRHA